MRNQQLHKSKFADPTIPKPFNPPPKLKDSKVQGMFWNQGLKQYAWVDLNQAIDEFSMYSRSQGIP